ncbi:hypothetical protein ACTXT7_003335 [Hymenolepis weldensis]
MSHHCNGNTVLNDPASAKRRSLLIDWEKAFEEAGLPPPPSPPDILQHPPRDVNSEVAASYKEKSRDLCAVCKKPLYAAESRAYDGFRIHPKCFRCVECQRPLRPDIAHCQYHLTSHVVSPLFALCSVLFGFIPSQVAIVSSNLAKFYCTNHFHPTSKKTSTSGSSKMSTRAPTYTSVKILHPCTLTTGSQDLYCVDKFHFLEHINVYIGVTLQSPVCFFIYCLRSTSKLLSFHLLKNTFYEVITVSALLA